MKYFCTINFVVEAENDNHAQTLVDSIAFAIDSRPEVFEVFDTEEPEADEYGHAG